MEQRKAERALLLGGRKAQLFAGGQHIEGGDISNSQLDVILQEVTPATLRGKLLENGRHWFAYECEHGKCTISFKRRDGVLHVTVEL